MDIDLLRQTAEVFKGTHNFTNFTKRKQKTTERTIEDIIISRPEIDEDGKNKNNNFAHLNKTYSPIFVDIYGESFLWNMVRKMMRVFLDVNYGKLTLDDVRTVEEELIYHLRKLGYIDDLKASRFRIAGRTDAGVHSLGNVISFQSEKEVRVNQINNSLPDDIQIIAWAPVRFGFKPRYAQMRWYRYILFEIHESEFQCKQSLRQFVS